MKPTFRRPKWQISHASMCQVAPTPSTLNPVLGCGSMVATLTSSRLIRIKRAAWEAILMATHRTMPQRTKSAATTNCSPAKRCAPHRLMVPDVRAPTAQTVVPPAAATFGTTPHQHHRRHLPHQPQSHVLRDLSWQHPTLAARSTANGVQPAGFNQHQPLALLA